MEPLYVKIMTKAADVDNWDVICKTPCCRAQAEYCCRTIPFSYNSDDYNEVQKMFK